MRLPITLLALLTSGAPAQALVSPAHFTDVGGNASSVLGPGSTKTPYTIQQVHDDLNGNAFTLKRITFRRSWYDTADYPVFSLKADLTVSTAKVTHLTARADFAYNHGPDKAVVAQGVTFTFPAIAYRRLPPIPFTHILPLGKPFVFGGKGALCWELAIASRTNTTSRPIDGFYRGDPFYYACRYFYGQGCTATGRTRPVTINQNHVLYSATGNFNYRAYDCPPSAPGFFTVGRSATAWGGVPLPLAIPGTAGAASGTCHLYAEAFLLLPATSDAYGNMAFLLPAVPLGPWLHNLTLYSQVLAPDPKANPTGVVTSDLAAYTLRAPFAAPPITVVFQAGGPTQRISRLPNQGLIVRLD